MAISVPKMIIFVEIYYQYGQIGYELTEKIPFGAKTN